jgi:two-component system NtrC family response regulator
MKDTHPSRLSKAHVTRKTHPKVLVVDDDAEVGRFFEDFLREERGCRVAVATSGREARSKLRMEPFDLAFVDMRLPDATGTELLTEIRKAHPRCHVIIMTGYSTTKSAVDAIRLGAFDYVEKPIAELEQLEEIVDRAILSIESKGATSDALGQVAANFNIVLSHDSPVKPVLEVAGKIAKKNLTVLIHGPTGAGKEVLARFIHANSHRGEKPFISVNCGAFAETLLESELFGHERGAFTGALAARRGIFEVADGGTLFLDEIGEATSAIQVKLLRALETGEFTRVGGEHPHRTDVRIIAATNVDLKQAVERGAFRKDLFYRLDVVSLSMPPLRERPSDIEVLMRHFVDKSLPPAERGTVSFTARARETLLGYDWPGNVRELSNVIARAMALRDGNSLDVDVLPDKISDREQREPRGESDWKALIDDQGLGALVEPCAQHLFDEVTSGRGSAGLSDLMGTLRDVENRVAVRVIERVLQKTGRDRAQAARLLRVNERVLRYYLRERGK